MIKVKTFTMGSSNNILHHGRLDGQINNFIAENNVEVIDVKYSTSCCSDSMGNIHCIPTAMLIYKEM